MFLRIGSIRQTVLVLKARKLYRAAGGNSKSPEAIVELLISHVPVAARVVAILGDAQGP